jgi:hypothetical protein
MRLMRRVAVCVPPRARSRPKQPLPPKAFAPREAMEKDAELRSDFLAVAFKSQCKEGVRGWFRNGCGPGATAR